MSEFLAEMAEASERRARALASRPAELLALAQRSQAPLPLDFGPFGVIAEIKPRAPSTGLLGELDVASATRRALAYAEGGAACVSVLTEPTRFDGSLAHLAAISAALRAHGVPTMRKDFLVDPLQVAEARIAGASGVLLVTRMLDDARLREMLDVARELGLFVLVEAFDERDLVRTRAAIAAFTGRVCVGLNCRDLRTLALDRARLARLAPALPRGLDCVAESGIDSPEDVRFAAELGYRAVLVGTSLMRASDPAAAVRALRGATLGRTTEGAPCT